MDAVTDFLSGVDDSALSVNESVNDGYLETRCLIDDALSSWDSKAFAILQSGITKLGGIYKAALSADTSGIFRIVKKQGLDAPLNEADDNGCTPLMYAALSDSRSTIEMLLNFGVKREQTDSYGRTAVHYASFFGKSKALQFLIESGSDWTSRDIYGITPMHWACASKNIKCLSILLNYASAVNGDKDPEDFEGMTPAHCASKYDSFKHLTILYEANCNFLKTDVRGKTVLHWTADNSSTLLLEAIISNHPYLLNKKDNSGHSVLHLCAFKGNVVIIEYLLNTEGIDIDIRDKYDRTPLHLACIGGHSQVVQILLLYHALESCIDSFGLTPLHYAVNVKSLECVQELVATPYIKHAPSADERGITPLILAAEFGFLEILKILLSNPLIAQEVNYCDSSGYSGLHYATFGGFYDCVVCLLQYNCDPNLLDNSGASALDMACERQHFDCITALLTGGSSTTIVGHDGYTVIHRVVVNQQIKVFELFLKFGCDMYSMDGNGQTPIQLAIRCGNEDMLESLLNFGIDPNQLEMSGLTLVHMASFEGNYKALSLMIKHGGYVNNMDETEYQYTPLDYAILNGETKCINFLKEQGGLTILDIKTTAAVCIQSQIRKYQAKKLLEVMKQSKQAAICIQKNIRGFLARRNHLIHLQRCKAVIKIQAALRGFIARRIFRNSLQVYYEEKEKREDMKKFGMSLLDIKANLQTITIECNIQPTTIEETRLQKNLYEKTERSFMLFDQYAFVNAEWKKFGIGEKQRQDNVKKQREKEILMKTVHDCQERKNYITEKFKHSKTVRSHQQAAQIIQQAYFKSKERQRKYIENEKHKFQRKLAYQMDAAKVIQRSWRHYRDWKLFENDHLSPVNTGPVLNLPHNITNSDSTTFRRKTLISGNSRRQLHSTNKAGFMVFKNISMATDIPHVTVTKNKLCMMTPNSRSTQLQNRVYTS